MLPVLGVAKDGGSAFRKDALTLLGILCDQHPASAVLAKMILRTETREFCF